MLLIEKRKMTLVRLVSTVNYLMLLKTYNVHSLKLRPGGGGLIQEMIQVCDYDILIVLIELNTLI